MKVRLLSHTPEPEKLIACSAKLCYSGSSIEENYTRLTDENASEFVQLLTSMGHENPMENVSFTFGIEGVSRTFLAQITRHRMASFMVQSQRYVKFDNFSYVIPPHIEAIPEAKAVFVETMEADLKAYITLTDILQHKHMDTMLKQGIVENEASYMAEKMAIEDARFVLPNACNTQMIVTMNARSLHNFFKHRCCSRAQWEIKAVADEMLKIVCEIAPTLFSGAGPSCYNKSCPEGKKSCGYSKEMKDFYFALHAKSMCASS